MPDRTTLQVGDSIRIIKVPDADLRQRTQENSYDEDDDMLPTATVLEMIMEQRPVVIIEEIDEYSKPWFFVRLNVDNDLQNHSLAVMDDESWELVYRQSDGGTPPKEHDIAKVKYEIDQLMLEHEEEYLDLAERSEKLYDQQEALKKAYEELDKKTGLNALFERLGALKNDK